MLFKMRLTRTRIFPEAYRRLAFLHKNHLDDVKMAEEYFELAHQSSEIADEQRRRRDILELPEIDEHQEIQVDDDFGKQLPNLRSLPKRDVISPDKMDPDKSIVIVTGLPRSGTSLMMQMLAAGGVEPMTDGQRTADEDNPKGYLETGFWSKNLARDNSWVVDAQGKSIKVIAQLLEYLPAKFNYKVVFMDRDIDEIISSQNTMLNRKSTTGADVDDARLKVIF